MPGGAAEVAKYFFLMESGAKDVEFIVKDTMIQNSTIRTWVMPGAAVAAVGFLVWAGMRLPAKMDFATLAKEVLPQDGVMLPIRWGDLGRRMIAAGVIDEEKFRAVYAERGGFPSSDETLLSGAVSRAEGVGSDEVRMTPENAHVFLNLLWVFGLANTNPILTEGPMTDPQYGGAHRFASTGGWTLARGDAMAHYSAHEFVALSTEEQKKVARVAAGIFRPCCDNPTSFPDCNHGMAMLGLLELMAANGVSEEEMYRVAARVNAYWFPDTYLTIATYFRERGVPWDRVSPREALGREFSSASGFARIRSLVQSLPEAGGGGCGV